MRWKCRISSCTQCLENNGLEPSLSVPVAPIKLLQKLRENWLTSLLLGRKKNQDRNVVVIYRQCFGDQGVILPFGFVERLSNYY